MLLPSLTACKLPNCFRNETKHFLRWIRPCPARAQPASRTSSPHSALSQDTGTTGLFSSSLRTSSLFLPYGSTTIVPQPRLLFSSVQFSSVAQSCLFATPWAAACQASLSITNSQILLRLMSIESVKASNHLILCRPLFLPPSIFPSIGVFSDESVLCIRWPKYWSFNFSISPSNEYSGLISFRLF